MPCQSSAEQYALVVYIHSQLGDFVEGLRRELHPPHAHMPTHITVLPPRPLQGTEEEAVAMLRELGARTAPFHVELGEVASFLPITPTVFLRVCHAGYKMRELHDLLNRQGLEFCEPLPFMPHVTVAKLDDAECAARVLEVSRQRWEQFSGSHVVLVHRLSFVRGSGHQWTDLAEIELAALPR
jgi:2'-5' RNA ligase